MVGNDGCRGVGGGKRITTTMTTMTIMLVMMVMMKNYDHDGGGASSGCM